LCSKISRMWFSIWMQIAETETILWIELDKTLVPHEVRQKLKSAIKAQMNVRRNTRIKKKYEKLSNYLYVMCIRQHFCFRVFILRLHANKWKTIHFKIRNKFQKSALTPANTINIPPLIRGQRSFHINTTHMTSGCVIRAP
jgi:hypothetical protein